MDQGFVVSDASGYFFSFEISQTFLQIIVTDVKDSQYFISCQGFENFRSTFGCDQIPIEIKLF